MKTALECGFSGWPGPPRSPTFRIPKPFLIEFITASSSMVVRGEYSHMLPGLFSPPMAHPLGGWSAPRGGARPSGGVLLELGVQKQHWDPSAPFLKGGG